MARKKVPQPKEDFTGSMPVGRQHILSLSLLFILPILLFYSTILGDQQFMGHDTIQWRAGAESVIDYRAEHGEEPLWSINMFGGMPAYIVDHSKAILHLDNAVFDKLRMIWPAVPYWVLLSGTYLFFFLQGFRPLESTLGAVFIGFTTYLPIIIGAGHNIKFIAYSYIPWMLCGYWLITRSDKKWWGFFLFAIASTLEFRAGHPQVTYYFVYLFAALFFYDTWKHYKGQSLASWGKMTGLITTALILGLLGTADQYWRLMEYSPYSIRGGSDLADIAAAGGLSMEYAFTWSQGILESLTLLVPNLYGGDSGMAYWGEKPGTSGPHYLGAVAFLLFLIGILRSARTIKYVFLGAGLLTLTFSWGYHFPLNELWFNILPGFDKFRTPEMWLIVTVFAFSVISIFGLESCMSLVRKGKKGLRKLYLPMGIALGAGVLLLAGSGVLLPFESERERAMIVQQLVTQSELPPENPQVQQRADQIIQAQLVPERRQLVRNDTLRYLILVGAACLMILFYFQSMIGPGHLLLSLILLASLDMLTVGNRYISDHALADRQLSLTQVIQQQQSPADAFIRENKMDPQGYPYRAFPLDDNPFNNAIPSYFYPSIGGYSGAKLSLIQDVIDEGLFTGPQGINLPLLNMLNVKYISMQRRIPLPGLQEVFNRDGYYVYENTDVMPKAWFADRVVRAATPREAFGMILPQSGLDLEETAVVENHEEFETGEDSGSSVEVTLYTARNIEMNLTRTTPGFLVLSEVYYPPGWTATLNGEEVPIYKTNYLLRGVAVPAGNYTLAFSFNPASHRWGARISWASNIAQWTIGLVLVAGWWRRRDQGDDHEKA